MNKIALGGGVAIFIVFLAGILAWHHIIEPGTQVILTIIALIIQIYISWSKD